MYKNIINCIDTNDADSNEDLSDEGLETSQRLNENILNIEFSDENIICMYFVNDKIKI